MRSILTQYYIHQNIFSRSNQEPNLGKLVEQKLKQADETKAIIQWETFSNINRILNTVTHAKRALNKQKPATLVVSVEEKDNANAITFQLVRGDKLAITEFSQRGKGKTKRQQNDAGPPLYR